jgi:hypothetical protein
MLNDPWKTQYYWKRRLGAFSGHTFLSIFRINIISVILRYALKMNAHQI